MTRGTLSAVIVAAAAAAAALALAVPRPDGAGHCSTAGDCARCHRDSPPSTHTPAFVARTHGPAALLNRASCVGCHKEESCDRCHQTAKPPWHTGGFRAPARGRDEREEHARLAGRHREACAECHTTRFALQCSSCHRPDEDWMTRPGRGR